MDRYPSPPPLAVEIVEMINAGVLDEKNTEHDGYWAWQVRKPAEIHPAFQDNYREHGEVRWFRR